jgi:hypothetical protein
MVILIIVILIIIILIIPYIHIKLLMLWDFIFKTHYTCDIYNIHVSDNKFIAFKDTKDKRCHCKKCGKILIKK